jgi:hypothetical protein
MDRLISFGPDPQSTQWCVFLVVTQITRDSTIIIRGNGYPLPLHPADASIPTLPRSILDAAARKVRDVNPTVIRPALGAKDSGVVMMHLWGLACVDETAQSSFSVSQCILG